MPLAMDADLVSRRDDLAHERGISLHLLAHEEERRTHASAREDLEHSGVPRSSGPSSNVSAYPSPLLVRSSTPSGARSAGTSELSAGSQYPGIGSESASRATR